MGMEAVAEALCHLKMIRLYLKSVEHRSDEVLDSLRVDPLRDENGFAFSTVAGRLNLPTAFEVDPDSVSALARTDHVEVRMRILGGSSGEGSPLFLQRDALPCDAAVSAEVKWFQNSTLHKGEREGGPKMHCRNCGNIITKRLRGSRALPSPYWREVAELWFCYCGRKADQNLAALESLEDSICFEEGILMVGETVCVLSMDSVDASGTLMSPPVGQTERHHGQEAEMWSSIRCGTCRCHLGHLGPADGNPSNTRDPKQFSATLFKHRISTTSHGDLCPLFRFHRQEGSLAADLYTTSCARGSYRFLMKPLMASDPSIGIQLILMNWDLLLWLDGRSRFTRALKVMYKIITEGQACEAEQWAAEHGAERIYSPLEEITGTMEHLKLSTMKLPKSCRDYNGFRMGYFIANTPSVLEQT